MAGINPHFEQQKNVKAGSYTLVVTAAVFFLLFIINWQLPAMEEPLLNEGIEVNLGNSDFGEGDIPPMIPGEPAPEPAEQMANSPKSSPPAEEPVTSEDESDDPEAVTLPKPVAKTTMKPKPQTNETVATRKVSNDPPAPPQPKAKAQMGTYTGGNGKGGNNQDGFNNVKNQGVAGGNGDQGKPNGNINSDSYTGNGGTGKSGVSISRGLTGRSIMRYPSFEDDFNENAKIAMNIRVDENGRVTSAVYEGKGSTSSSPKLKEIARKKAMELKFNDGSSESIGTIVFNFRLKS